MKPLRQEWPEEFAQHYRQAGYWRGETFSAWLEHRTRASADNVAIVGGTVRWTYAELLAKAEATAAGFLALGLTPGERVLVQLPNIPEFFAVIFGLFRAGLVPVFTLPAQRLTEIAHFARKAEASAYMCADRHDHFDYRTLARDLQREVPAVRHVVVVGEAEEFVGFDRLPAGPLPAAAARASEVAFLQLSGGSTGLSKLIPRTHDDYLYSVRASAEICGLDRATVYLVALPVAHNFTMSSPGVLGVLHAGGRVVLSPSPQPATAFALIEQERVTLTSLVPPLALLWLQAAPSNKADLSSLRVLQVGGAKLLPEPARRIRPVLGFQLQQVFGMAEGLVNYTRADDEEEVVVTTQGRPISLDDEILIVDDDDRPLPTGEPGHLLTRGPYTIRGYHNEPEANARSFTAEGYYRTGDIVKQLPSGHLIVQGRASDHINRAGEKISADEIEGHLLAHPQVFDAVVISIPDAFLGERTCAFVIPNGEAPKSTALKAWMRTRQLAEFKVPDQVVFVPEFETTAVGKISRKELRAALRAQFLARAKATANAV